MRYSSRQLIHLAAVVETGSLSLAARSLGLSQPALTKSLTQLEMRVGAPLIMRDRTGARPTPLGAEVARYGQAMINAGHRVDVHVEDWHRGVMGHLIVGAPPSVAANLLPAFLAGYLADRTKVTMRVEIFPLTASLDALMSNQLDVYVGVSRPTHVPRGLLCQPIYRDELCVVARTGHPLLARSGARAADLSSYRWTAPFRGTFFRGLIDSACQRAGIVSLDIALETFSFDLQLSLVRQSDFLAMIPARVIHGISGLQRLPEVEAELGEREFTIAALFREDTQDSPLLSGFIRSLGHFVIEEI